jgi:hypothetical protein
MESEREGHVPLATGGRGGDLEDPVEGKQMDFPLNPVAGYVDVRFNFAMLRFQRDVLGLMELVLRFCGRVSVYGGERAWPPWNWKGWSNVQTARDPLSWQRLWQQQSKHWVCRFEWS